MANIKLITCNVIIRLDTHTQGYANVDTFCGKHFNRLIKIMVGYFRSTNFHAHSNFSESCQLHSDGHSITIHVYLILKDIDIAAILFTRVPQRLHEVNRGGVYLPERNGSFDCAYGLPCLNSPARFYYLYCIHKEHSPTLHFSCYISYSY